MNMLKQLSIFLVLIISSLICFSQEQDKQMVNSWKGDVIVSVKIADENVTAPKSGYYVVLFAIGQKSVALDFVKEATNKGVATKILYNKTKLKHIVYTHIYNNLSEALLRIESMKKKGFDEASVYVF